MKTVEFKLHNYAYNLKLSFFFFSLFLHPSARSNKKLKSYFNDLHAKRFRASVKDFQKVFGRLFQAENVT